MKVKNLYISEKFKIIGLEGTGYLGYETEFDNYTLVKVQKNGKIKDVQNLIYYKSVDDVGKCLINRRCLIPLSWFTTKEDIEKEEALKIVDGVSKILKLKKDN